MNKKLLFAAMSLAALTACTNDDFESKNVANVAGETSPVQFEVINSIDAGTRASMSGNTVVWSAKDGDLFTLYHGAAALGDVTGYENATYSAKAEEGSTATLTTPTMIKKGGAIMVWPVDTNFRIKTADALTLTIPVVQGGKVNNKETIQNQIPYVSDLIDIEAYAAYSETAAPGVIPTAYKTAGKDRKYAVYMRPMASQLNLNADYAGTDETLATLYEGEDPIGEIKVTSVDLLTKDITTTPFTTEIPVKFTAPGTLGIPASQWAAIANNKWSMVTDFDIANIGAAGKVAKLTTKCLTGNASSKFLILPQATIADGTGGLADAGIVVNTIYGKVVIADGVHGSLYTASEIADAWYRYVSAVPVTEEEGETTDPTPLTIDEKTKYKATSNPKYGLKQTLNGFSAYKAEDGVVKSEPIGAATKRYVKVLLTHLDMSGLHITSDKQLRDAARVWKQMGLTPVTVYLDGDANKEFAISQKTIETINTINAGTLNFKVQPCQGIAGEVCNTIVVTGGGDVQNMAFIADNGGFAADVVFNAGETWTWKGAVDVTATGVAKIINKGAMQNTEGSTLVTKENGIGGAQNNVLLENKGTWTISGGEINVTFDVTNYGTLTIRAGAEYRQAKGSANTTFTNEATNKPSRFVGGNDAEIGVIHNSGVFATLAATGSTINNYGEIYHDNANAKTYITANETSPVDFASAFADPGNKMGMIILPYDNKDEDNISVKAALNQGFVAVAVNAGNAPTNGILDAATVGPRVNYIKIDGGINTVSTLPSPQIKYVEFNSGNTEIAWAVTAPQNYDGMMVLSPVNIKLGTTITVADATYLGANMYVGGTFNKGSWNGYFGNTASYEASKYITY